jgi:hypothetical protein
MIICIFCISIILLVKLTKKEKGKQLDKLKNKKEKIETLLIEIQKQIIELSIMKNCFCPECGSRIWKDNDYVRCIKENGKCSYDSLYRWIVKPVKEKKDDVSTKET